MVRFACLKMTFHLQKRKFQKKLYGLKKFSRKIHDQNIMDEKFIRPSKTAYLGPEVGQNGIYWAFNYKYSLLSYLTKALTEHFLQGNVPLGHLLNAKPPFMS